VKATLSAGWSAFLHEQFGPAKRSLLGWRAARSQSGWPRPWIPVQPRRSDERPSTAPSLVEILRNRGSISGIGADLEWLRSRSGFSTAWRRIGVFIDLLSQPGVPDGCWRADLADAIRDPGPVLGFCSNLPESILVPDRGFHAGRGYARERLAAAAAAAFEARDPTLVWRGSPTGRGDYWKPGMLASDPGLRQRVRMCLVLRDAMRADPRLGVDARIIAGRSVAPDAAAAYREAGIDGGTIPQESWLGRRFAIDIDGNANAFSNLFIRLVYGCCVLKVASPAGFRQWYYDRLEPWRHFIPVAADLSDLVERIGWCREHPDECRQIAAAGRSLALSMTPATETRLAVERLHGRPPVSRPMTAT